MKALLFAACFALACASPTADPDVKPLMFGSDGGVQRTQQALSNVTVRISRRLQWTRPWDTVIANGGGGCGLPETWSTCSAQIPEALNYISPTFNLYVAPVAGGPALYSGYRAADSTAFYTRSGCTPNEWSGYNYEDFRWPDVSGFQNGVTYKAWFMLRCSNGSWPASGPTEASWSATFTVPASGTFFTWQPAALSGFWAARSWWAAWLHGCPSGLDPAWDNGLTIPYYICRSQSCQNCCDCDDGVPAGTPTNLTSVVWP